MSDTPRLSYYQAAPEAMATVLAMTRFLLESSSLEHPLLNLVQLRASQINGCAFCTLLHVNDARDDGETDDRMHALTVWRDTPYFSERERIALDWTEILTRLPEHRVDDATYARAVAEFGERGLTELTLAVAAINAWNRFGVAFQAPPNPKLRSKAAILR
jgi:AhpD family alkylhydroperoxidase